MGARRATFRDCKRVRQREGITLFFLYGVRTFVKYTRSLIHVFKFNAKYGKFKRHWSLIQPEDGTAEFNECTLTGKAKAAADCCVSDG